MIKLDLTLCFWLKKPLSRPRGESGELRERSIFRGRTIRACFRKTGSALPLRWWRLMISPSVTSSQSWL